MVKFWFNGLVVIFMLLVCLYFGCLGVFEFYCLNCLSFLSFKLLEICNKLYNKVELWFVDRINLFLLKKFLDWGLKLRWCVYKVYVIGVVFIGNLGCFEFVFLIVLMFKVCIVFIVNWFFLLNIVVFFFL